MMYILENWPLTFICLAMIVAAVIDGWILKVPNWLTFPLILSGWALGGLRDFGYLETTLDGGFVSSFACTVLGFILLYPVHAIGGMGAGDVKMQMGFGSWVGAFYSMGQGEAHPGSMWIVLYAFCLATVIGAVIAVIMMLVRGNLKQNLANLRSILGDFTGSSGVEEIADKAAKRKPTMHLLPYGIPLCLGFISYLVYLHSF